MMTPAEEYQIGKLLITGILGGITGGLFIGIVMLIALL